MKRIIAVLLIGILTMTGCVNNKNIDNDDEVVNFKLIYLANAKDSGSRHRILINFDEKAPTVDVLDYETDLVTKYDVTDVVNLKAYIDKLKNDPELFKYEDTSGKAEEILWHVQIDTIGKSYSTGDKSEYPAFWDEIWDMLIEYSDAEDKTDFGIGKDSKKMSAVKKVYEDKTDTYKKTIEYPELSGTDKADKINKVIYDAVLNFPLFNLDNYSDYEFLTMDAKYEFVRKTGGVLSIKYDCYFYSKGTPHPINTCYGITINTATGELIDLGELISYDNLVDCIENEKYGVEYGAFSLMSKEEIMKDFNEVIKESEYSTYIYNFYEDGIYVYLVIDEVMASDYGILRFKK